MSEARLRVRHALADQPESQGAIIVTKRPTAGPEADIAFFEDIKAVMTKYPDAATKYSIRYIDVETERLRINFDQQVAISRAEDNQIVTRFVDRGEVDRGEVPGLEDRYTTDEPDFWRFCCEWVHRGDRIVCVRICS